MQLHAPEPQWYMELGHEADTVIDSCGSYVRLGLPDVWRWSRGKLPALTRKRPHSFKHPTRTYLEFFYCWISLYRSLERQWSWVTGMAEVVTEAAKISLEQKFLSSPKAPQCYQLRELYTHEFLQLDLLPFQELNEPMVLADGKAWQWLWVMSVWIFITPGLLPKYPLFLPLAGDSQKQPGNDNIVI